MRGETHTHTHARSYTQLVKGVDVIAYCQFAKLSVLLEDRRDSFNLVRVSDDV